MKRLLMIILGISVGMTLFAVSPPAGKPGSGGKSITVFIAASTSDLMEAVGDLFSGQTGITVHLNPASSGVLARQLEQGAPADCFVSASREWMQYIEVRGLLQESRSFIRNRLVLIAPAGSELAPVELNRHPDLPALFSGRISLGEPAHVPAGKYALEALRYYGWYEALAPRFMPAADVRAALAVVEMGEVELGIVYATDARKSDRVKVIALFPEEAHSPVESFCALLVGAGPEGEAFYHFLLEEEAVIALYAQFGFSAIE